MDIPLPEVVRVWRGGCIIRSGLLNLFANAYKEDDLLPNLLLDANIAKVLQLKEGCLADVVSQAAQHSYPVRGFNGFIKLL